MSDTNSRDSKETVIIEKDEGSNAGVFVVVILIVLALLAFLVFGNPFAGTTTEEGAGSESSSEIDVNLPDGNGSGSGGSESTQPSGE